MICFVISDFTILKCMHFKICFAKQYFQRILKAFLVHFESICNLKWLLVLYKKDLFWNDLKCSLKLDIDQTHFDSFWSWNWNQNCQMNDLSSISSSTLYQIKDAYIVLNLSRTYFSVQEALCPIFFVFG